ncbi:hypothetical protein DCAR_0207135 [Daucus carota subsp. sativus]|uniref:Uncharacterized protein n=1 Tax=Daucus carota subsp. sativus TaxID=79200 RepID=A0A175Y9B9_DAUCS|nr:hypothetical protein DCAR_0207135 [Daucus carota subsp. sativus]
MEPSIRTIFAAHLITSVVLPPGSATPVVLNDSTTVIPHPPSSTTFILAQLTQTNYNTDSTTRTQLLVFIHAAAPPLTIRNLVKKTGTTRLCQIPIHSSPTPSIHLC